MPLISLCMIVKNEAKMLGRCLDSISDLIDEIIVVDTGSIDETKRVVAAYEAKIYDFPWQDDFAAARNYAVSQAVGDYWMWLDADDVIDPESHDKLRKIFADPGADVVFLPYYLQFDAFGAP
ncbi:MAG: glycosyltransferase family 2 protein [Ruminococcus sp.]|nr:glycosyltransferase family 2 protein [Ruminococcus sp.]